MTSHRRLTPLDAAALLLGVALALWGVADISLSASKIAAGVAVAAAALAGRRVA